MKYSAEELASIIGEFPPTAEQTEIIEGPVDQPAVVIAGAGSGKTAVIAQRVLWLIANGHVDKNRILALTFTRKAVGELAERIGRFIRTFEQAADTGRKAPGRGLEDLFGPTIQTYNSYASALVSQYGLSIGIEEDTEILDDAEAVQEFGRIVDAADDRDIPAGKSRAGVIANTLHLASQIDEHLTTSQEVIDFIDASLAAAVGPEQLEAHAKAVRRKRFPKEEKEALEAQLSGLAVEAASMRTPTPEFVDRAVEVIGRADTSSLITSLLAKRQYAVLAGRWKDYKRSVSRMQFSDQVVSAYRLMDQDDEARAAERERWDIILLDEYQDTSDSQFRLLQKLFAGRAVTAVGDHRQSIYGWRGASAGNLADFPGAFTYDGAEAREYTLTTSWRNAPQILAAANRVSDSLPAVSKSKAQLKPKPGADDPGRVTVCLTPGNTDEDHGLDQYRELAQWMKRQDGTRAVLLRAGKAAGPVADALHAEGIEYTISGSRGSLDNPYVADVVAALFAAVDITASTEVMRLLSGPQTALGAADIRALHAYCSLRGEGMDDDAAPTLIECIDEFADLDGIADHASQTGLTDAALGRLRRLALRLRAVRRGASTPIDAVRSAVRVFSVDLDIDALANPEPHRKALDSLKNMAAAYGRQHPSATAADFLAWLMVAEEQQALEAAADEADPATVQIMTIHASKGLEFDAVAIPNNTIGDLPSKVRSKQAWLSGPELPYPLRGDRKHLLELDTRTVDLSTTTELNRQSKEWIGPAVEEHHLTEERRLAYVAVTRAKTQLWLGASTITTRKTSNELSPFLEEICDELGQEAVLPDVEADDIIRPQTVMPWPPNVDEQTLDHRTELRAVLRAAEGAELESLAEQTDPGEVSALAARAIELMRPEEAEELADLSRMSTTALVDYVGDPDEFSRRRARPMPQKPSSAAALGTEFHAWIENRYEQSSLLEFDEHTPRRLKEHDRRRLAELKETFEASEFASRRPAEVELPFELKVGPRVVSGKIDAVFDDGQTVEVVDWKTGASPRSERDIEVRAVQLSMYAQAVARMPKYAGRTIRAAFYFVGDDSVLRFDSAGSDAARSLMSWAELEQAVSG